MAKLSQIIMIATTLCLLTLAFPVMTLAKGPPIKVEQAEPDFAFQAEKISMKVKGRNLPKEAAVVFILNKEGDPDNGSIDQITVSGPITLNPATGDLEFEIDVATGAKLGDYDIEVIELSSGRKGKGTTLFKVLSADNEFTPVEITAGYYFCDEDQAPDGCTWDELSIMDFVDPYPTSYPGWENWENNTLQHTPRPCSLGSWATHPPTGGRYDCYGGDYHGGGLSIDMVPLQGTWVDVTSSKKPYPGFCKLLDVWDAWQPGQALDFGATRYKVDFMTGCTTEDCSINFRAESYSGDAPGQGYVELHPFRRLDGLPDDQYGDAIGKLPDVYRFFFSAEVGDPGDSNLQWPDADELNLFTKPQVLPVAKFMISFTNSRNKTLASCLTTAVENVYFVTEPQSGN